MYSQVLYPAYPNELQRPLILALIQMLWDRSDPNGYAHHITTDPYARRRTRCSCTSRSATTRWRTSRPNTAPNLGDDPHSDPRSSPVGRQQKSDFLQTDGAVTDVCLGAP